MNKKKVHILDSAINDEHSSLCDNENDKVNQLDSDIEKSKIQINSDLELDQVQKDTHIHVDTNSGSSKENILDFSSENVVNIQSNSILNEKIINEDLSGVSEKNIQMATERKKRLQKFHNLNFQNQIILKDLEDEPAYKRQGLELDEVDHSNSTSSSRFFLDSSSEDAEIKNNNSFLHDNVD